jgi:prenyltransferase beta subunit
MNWRVPMQKISRLTCCAVLVSLALAALLSGTAMAKDKAKVGEFDFAKTGAFIREMESRPDFPVSVVLANDYVFSLLTMGDAIDPARRDTVIVYLKKSQQKDGGFVSDKTNRSASLLYTDMAIETLGRLNAVGAMDAGRVKAYVGSLKNPDGGFGFSRESKESSLASTFYAVRILKAVNGIDLVDKAKTAGYVKGFERNNGGFGYVKGTGVANPKNTYMAAFSLNALGSLDNATRKNAVKFLALTPYLDKKSEERPELDQQLYAVMALKELKAPEKIDKKLALNFLKKLYIPTNGGFGPLEGYGSTPDSTSTGLRILQEIGKLKKAPSQVAKK